MDTQRRKYSGNPVDLKLIDDLQNAYVTAWNKVANSRGKGPATGRAFEEWIENKLRLHGKNVEKGKIKFSFGEFKVDATIPSLSNPNTILEIKVYTDIQHSLMVGGLISGLTNPNIKVGLVTLYEPGAFYATKTPVIKNILNNYKANFQNKFDYFHIENGWSTEIARLVSFC